MNAEIITIGDEILIGQTIDTNSAWLGKELYEIGISVKQITSIKDAREDIIGALDLAATRAELILITGGLGPTQDDITKQVLCEYFNTELVVYPDVLEKVRSFFKSRGREMLESNNMQASLPKDCTIIPNNLGTACGMLFNKAGKIFVSMPGVPYEMKVILVEVIFLILNLNYKLSIILHISIITEAIGESFLAERIVDWENSLIEKQIKIAYLPSPGIVKIRLSLIGQDKSKMEEIIEQKVAELKQLIPVNILADQDITLENTLAQLLIDNAQTVSTAESCTGGIIAHLLTSISGSSNYFVGSIISYSNEIKIQELGVKKSDIETYGAVSKEVVEQMAVNVRKKMKTDYALATSGIAGPNGGSEEKPVGTVWIALAYEGGVFSKKFLFEKDRERNIQRATYAALSLLKRKICGQLV